MAGINTFGERESKRVHLHMDINWPVDCIKSTLQQISAKDISNYDVWLESTQLHNTNTLREFCIVGAGGWVEVRLCILDTKKCIVIEDVVTISKRDASSNGMYLYTVEI